MCFHCLVKRNHFGRWNPTALPRNPQIAVWLFVFPECPWKTIKRTEKETEKEERGQFDDKMATFFTLGSRTPKPLYKWKLFVRHASRAEDVEFKHLWHLVLCLWLWQYANSLSSQGEVRASLHSYLPFSSKELFSLLSPQSRNERLYPPLLSHRVMMETVQFVKECKNNVW